jgi:hypothetical protein
MPDEPRPQRKRSPRPFKTAKRSLTRSASHKLLWSDPEYRAKMIAARARSAEDRRANPAKYSRLGVPDGMRRATALKAWSKARTNADAFMATLEEHEVVPVIVVPDSDEALAKAALREAAVLALGPTDRRTKNMAIHTVLTYTKGKPIQKITSATDWLRLATLPPENEQNVHEKHYRNNP